MVKSCLNVTLSCALSVMDRIELSATGLRRDHGLWFTAPRKWQNTNRNRAGIVSVRPNIVCRKRRLYTETGFFRRNLDFRALNSRKYGHFRQRSITSKVKVKYNYQTAISFRIWFLDFEMLGVNYHFSRNFRIIWREDVKQNPGVLWTQKLILGLTQADLPPFLVNSWYIQ